MSVVEIVSLLVAGMLAGTINTVVGSGTLITFPDAAAVRLPAGHGQRDQHIGLVPGGLAGIYGYRPS